MTIWVQSLASLSGLRMRPCHKLWHGLQMWLRSSVAWLWCRPVAAAPIWSLAQTSIWHRCSPKKKENPLFEFCLFYDYFLWLHPWTIEVPRPGTESKLQLRPTPQPWQCGILNPLCHSRNTPTYSYSVNEIIYFFKLLLLFLIPSTPFQVTQCKHIGIYTYTHTYIYEMTKIISYETPRWFRTR